MTNCAGCLKKLRKADGDFCPACRAELFDGAAVAARLSFGSPAQVTMAEVERFRALTRQISISGVQEKFSLTLELLARTTLPYYFCYLVMRQLQ